MKICEAGRSSGCCRNPDIRTINTMGADTQGNFSIRGDQGIHVTVGTNEIIITGVAVYYDNTDGNIVIDNDLMTINLADDLAITDNISIGGDLGVTGDAVIAGDLTVNGTYYTVHAEHVYTEDDYIIMRDGAVTGLGSGDFSGFQVKLYDGVNDGRLVIDNTGTARVGDVGDEQPLLTREESADLSNGEILTWDAANSKAVGVPIDATPTDGSSNPVSSDGVYDSRFTQVLYRSGLTISNSLPATISELTQLDDDCIIFFCFKNNTTGLEQWYSAPFHTQHAFFSGTDTNRFNNNDVPYIFGFSVTWSRTTGEVTVTSKHTHGGSDTWSLDGFEYLNIINVYGRKV